MLPAASPNHFKAVQREKDGSGEGRGPGGKGGSRGGASHWGALAQALGLNRALGQG